VQRLRRLSGRRAARLDDGAFVIEGPTILRAAIDAGVALAEVFAAPEADAALVAAAEQAGAVVRQLPADVLARAIDTVTPQGVAAIAPTIEVGIDDAVRAAASGPLSLVLVDISDPGNAGTLVRTAEAAGAAAVLFCGGSVDPWNPKCVRAAAGALFHVPVASGGDAVAVLDRLAKAGVPSAATVVRNGTPYDEVDLTGPVAFVLGSEAHGLPGALVEAVHQRLTIPMVGRSESLNVAMAGSVLCFESLRQRRAAAR
jgi:RNA methyltransferase, TrmH family